MSFETTFRCIEKHRREGRNRFRGCRDGCLDPPRREFLSTVLSSVVMRMNGLGK